MKTLSRREFLRLLYLMGLGAVGAGTLLEAGCGPSGSPAIPTPRAVGSTPTPFPSPLPTGTLLPTIAPTATPSGAATLSPRTPTPPPAAGQAYLAVARGGSPAETTRAAIAALGGIERFVKSGNDVIVKPNICSASYSYEYAATTNPEVVATLVTLCLQAGAKRVRVMDSPFSGTDAVAYARSGIEEAVKQAGGEMERMARMKYVQANIPQGKDLKSISVYQDILKADVVINVPIAKTHNLARLTLAMKNLLGVIENRPLIHLNLGQRLADLTSLIRPNLTVVDAVRILTRGGPTGGDLSAVKKLDTVIASHDIVAADAYAATLFGMTGNDLDYVQAGAAMGLGQIDLKSLNIEEIRL
jgi:uncharacterized protein (DUF362 family)